MSDLADPVWLVQISSYDGSLEVNPVGLCLLQQIYEPVHVIAAFGPNGTGKSFLLNQLAGDQNGFPVPTCGRLTRPNMTMRVLRHCKPQDKTLVFLDTEGFDEKEAEQFFILAVLLSSTFLYNTKKDITLETLNKLTHVNKLTSTVQVTTIDGMNQSFLLSGVLPEFVWCVRDAELELTMGEVILNAQDYLDSVFNQVQDNDEAPGRHIQNLFNSHKLFDFCLPHGDRSYAMQLKPQFLNQVQTLQRHICQTHPKMFTGGQLVNGKILGTLLQLYAEKLSAGINIVLDDINEELTLGDCYDQALPVQPELESQNLTELGAAKMPTVKFTPYVGEDTSSRNKAECGRPSLEFQDIYSRVNASGSHLESVLDSIQMDTPVCLIENTKDNQLQMCQSALMLLESIQQPVVVVAIVGLYRTGKSFLMNKLAGKPTGFSLGSTIQSETKGIWMWCLPHPKKPGHTLVLLDTEGLGDVEKGDQKNDNWIFAMAVLLSSTLVYNSMGTINNEALLNLHYVTELTKHIKVKSQVESEEESSTGFSGFFPSFVWAVRDFTLELEKDGKPITEDQYLETALQLKSGTSKKVLEYNMPRECIQTYFPWRKCFVFDRPSSRANLQKLEMLEECELEPDFVNQAKAFCDHILGASMPKTLKGGIGVTGFLLAKLAVTYVDAIRCGKIPCLENAVHALAEIENSSAVQMAFQHYKEEINKKADLPTEDQKEMSDLHSQCEKEALHIFMSRSFKDDDQKFQAVLAERIKKEYEDICQKNAEQSKNFCVALLLQMGEDLEYSLENNYYLKPGGYEDFQQDLGNTISQYNEATRKGIKAKETLSDYLKEKDTRGSMILAADKAMTENEKQQKEEQAKVELAKWEAATLDAKLKDTEMQLEDQRSSYNLHIQQLQDKMESDRRKAVQEHERLLNKKLQEQKAMLEQGFKERADQLEAEIRQLRSQGTGRGPCGSFLGNVVRSIGRVFGF
ncbi:guanylate-binding protein 1-like isoform X2 [Erpetoichthys calabaricus]|uniref:guanylate-binding protein 1-like isoform X2 n=1 Tax=Erpetoichthys calabaricus TaxID=27687 RepID=UPI002234097A|nr:guanylate-binding protein 1-like isoform X2 [Erpetoichthys calabaricus]